MKVEQQHLLSEFAEIVRRENPLLSKEAARARAKNTLSSLAYIASFGMVKRVAAAIGSAELSKTYEKTIDRTVPAERLIHVSVGLDHQGEFPMSEVRETAHSLAKSPMAHSLLCALVRHHFSLFPTPLPTKQQVCSHLGMRYTQLEQSSVELRYLSR
jgi:hypothetical protein